MADQAQAGQTVRVHYTGRLDDDTVFDSSREGDPLTIQLGAEQVIPGFENAVIGMQPGEEKTVTLPPEKAYGDHRDDLVFPLEREQIPGTPQQGQQLRLTHPSGTKIPVTVTDVGDDNVTVDANHVLAGKTLTFDIELVDIVGSNGQEAQETEE